MVADQNMQEGTDLFRIDSYNRNDGVFSGVFIKLRTGNDARVGSIHTPGLNHLRLEQGQVLTEFLAFSYFPAHNVIGIARNRYVGSGSKLTAYFDFLFARQGIYLRPIIRADAMNRLQRMQVFNKLEVTIAAPREVDQDIRSALGLLEDDNDTNLRMVQVLLSSGKSQVGLGGHILEWFLRKVAIARGNGQLTKAKAVGRLDHEKTVIDLLEDRIFEVMEVLPAREEGHIEDLSASVRVAYERRRAEIENLMRDLQQDR